jgi:hypothetical protein
MGASYVSTGAGGTDYEVDAAASALARLLGQAPDRLLASGSTPQRVMLQDRTGPAGFDDLSITAVDPAGDAVRLFVQAKRRFSFAADGAFAKLLHGVAAHDLIDGGAWQAAIMFGEANLPTEDVETLFESARQSADAAAFRARWEHPGATNPTKRDLLAAVRTALPDDDDAVWRAMKRTIIVSCDYHLVRSRDRDAAIATLGQSLSGSAQDASALFARLRDLALRHAQRAGQWSRMSLAAELGVRIVPARSISDALALLSTSSSEALHAIPTHIQGIATFPALSLLRPEAYREARNILAIERCLRLSGEGGSGKSGMLRRLAAGFDGAVLALRDDRVAASSWATHAGALGLSVGAREVVDELSASGPCLLVIDGADRMLLSTRRGVVLDLLRAIAACPLRERWSIITSARDFQTRDLVANAMEEAGLTDLGRRCAIGSLPNPDIALLSETFPAIGAVARRGDLGDRNRILFVLREVLASPKLPAPCTEIGLAAAWASRGAAAELAQPERDHALATIGELLLCRPDRKPGRADVHPAGLAQLEAEDIVYAHPTRDNLAFTHDVHEDWVLARTFDRHRQNLPELIDNADQPLWWLRAMRLLGQMLLETEAGPAAWLETLAALDAYPGLDPAWSRSLLVAPLYSERSAEILGRIEPALLADNATLLIRLINTLLVYETRLDERLMRAPALADMGETERLRVVASIKHPQWRSWIAFLRWSLPKWRQWPASIIPQLAELASSWTFATEGEANWVTEAMMILIGEWLTEIEDANHTESWDDRRDPFGIEEVSYGDWEKVEKSLRRTLKMGLASAPDIVTAYLRRLVAEKRLDDARSDMLENPRSVPARLALPYVDMAIVQLTPRRQRVRHDYLGIHPDCFSPLGFNQAGITDDPGFSPASPLRGGFADLFASDEAAALRLFHRLEMRASVFYRQFIKWQDHRKARPVRLETSWGAIPLWGEENVYRFSRAILGSPVLGSAYLALERWLAAQAGAGRPLAELFQLVLQPNGLVATASPCINLLAEHINTPGQVDGAAPFLGAPRLWDYDLRRFQDDRTHGPMGYMGRDDHYDATAEVHARYAKRSFLSRDLLLPFQLMAGADAKQALQDARERWTAADLAGFDDQLDDPETVEALEDRLRRIRSDSDAAQISLEQSPQGDGLIAQIQPPAEDLAAIEQLNREQAGLNEAARLWNWVHKSRKQGTLDPALSLADAIALADRLEAIEGVETYSNAYLVTRHRASAIVGTAALVARHASDEELSLWLDWARARILGGCLLVRPGEDEALLINQARLFDDPQLYGTEGLAAFINRGVEERGDRRLALKLATHRLDDIATALVHGLDWNRVPNFAWAATVAAFDICDMRRHRFWMKGDDKRAARTRRRDRQRAIRRALTAQVEAPRPPQPPYAYRWFRQKKWRWPLARKRVQSKRVYDWSRAPVLLKALDCAAIARDPVRATAFGAYLTAVAGWAHAHAHDEVADRFRNRLPYDLVHALAGTAGRLAAAGADPTLWEMFKQFDRRDRDEDLIADYMDAIATELVTSERAPDERFWTAWQPPADFALAGASRPRRYRPDYDQMDKVASAAGFVGPYMSPIPPDWPHVGALLPAIDRWVEVTAYSASAGYALLSFATRLTIAERSQWLVQWLEIYAEQHQSDPRFWTYGSNGDRAAGLLQPLESTDAEKRRRIRRLLGMIADAGSLAARDLLGRFVGARS